MLPGPELQLTKANSVRVLVAEVGVLEVLRHQLVHDFVPPWMLASTSRMSPTPSSAPVAGMICITPVAPT